MILRKDRNKEFRNKVLLRFGYTCCFKPTIVPKWMSKNISEEADTHEKCSNKDDLKIYRKDGNINNNNDDNILLFCPYHYGVVYYELNTQVKRKENRMKGIRPEKKQIVVLDYNETKQFFNSIRNHKHLMLFQMCYYLGARVNEIINLKKKYINIKGTEGFVIFSADTTKRKVERDVVIPPNMIKPIKEYISNLDKEDILFPITKQRVWQLTNDYTKKSNLNKKISPHTFRHSYATKVYEDTGDLKLVQSLLGHKNMSTTSIYAHISKEYKKDKINKVFAE